MKKSKLKKLIDSGADVNARNEYGETPLHFQRGKYAVELLIKAGANVNAKTRQLNTSLHYQSNKYVIKLLIDAGADVNAKNIFNLSPIHCHPDDECVRLLIEAGADVNSKTHIDNITPLHLILNNMRSVKLLIDAGADVNAQNNHGTTPLHCGGDKKCVRLLIEAGADVNVRDIWGIKPLDFDNVRSVVEDMASEKIIRFIHHCKWWKLHKLTKTFAFNKWYCGEEDGNGGGTGRKVDHKRIMDSVGRM